MAAKRHDNRVVMSQRPELAIGVMLGSLLLLAGCSQGQSQSPSAPTVQTGVTAVATPAVPGGSPTLAGPVQIAQVSVNNADATIFLQNVGAGGGSSAADVDLSGWKIQVASTTLTVPAGTKLASGATLGLHTGPAGAASPVASPSVAVAGPSTQQNLYLGSEGAAVRLALQPGAQVLLVNQRGEIVSQAVVP